MIGAFLFFLNWWIVSVIEFERTRMDEFLSNLKKKGGKDANFQPELWNA